jgi:hypothetical protein
VRVSESYRLENDALVCLVSAVCVWSPSVRVYNNPVVQSILFLSFGILRQNTDMEDPAEVFQIHSNLLFM